ncbi:snaclec 5-like [Crassostrea virginica]
MTVYYGPRCEEKTGRMEFVVGLSVGVSGGLISIALVLLFCKRLSDAEDRSHVTAASETCLTEKIAECRPDWVPYNGHCYLYEDSVRDTWFGAKTRCNELGGYLVEIEAADENTWLVSTFPVDEQDPVNNVHGKAVLIGASSEVETGPYTWSHSGQPVVYQAWYPMEPSSHPSEYCVVLRADGLWNNLPCQIQRQFVCESN